MHTLGHVLDEAADFMMSQISTWISARLGRYAPMWILIGFGLTMIGGYSALSLRVDQDFMALLPPDAPEVRRLAQLNQRLGNQTDLVIAIESPSRDANIQFGTTLAKTLRTREDMRWVLFRRDKDFFEKHALLYMDLDELLELRDDVVDRIKESVEENVTEDFEENEDAEKESATAAPDPLSEQSIADKYDIDERMPEYMETDEGRLMVIKARPRIGPNDLEYAEQLNHDIQNTIQSLRPAGFHPEMTINIEGSFAEQTKRGRNMRSAVVDGSLAALFILLLSIAIFFRSLRAVGWVLVPLLISVISALGFASAYYGHLNLVSAFIFAVLLGLGIDFAVHILSRYRDERGRGTVSETAWQVALSTTGVSTAAGALSTAGAFLVLSLSTFQGFAQFGVIAAVGVSLALLAALTLMPALTVLTSGKGHHTLGYQANKTAPQITPRTFPKAAAIVVIIALGFGVYGAYSIPQIEFEYDLSQLGPTRESEPANANTAQRQANTERWRDAAGRGTETAPAIALTSNLRETEQIHRQLSALIDKRDALKAKRPDPLPASPNTNQDNLAPDQNDEDDDDEDDPFENLEPQDITDIRDIIKATEVVEPDVAELLASYAPERHRVMVDRINKVFSVYDFVPSWQPEKLVLIRDMRRRIDAKRDALTEKDRQSVDKWYDKLQVNASFGPSELPEFVLEQLRDDDGQLGTFVLFWTLGPKANYKNSKRIRDAYFNLSVTGGTVPTAADYYALPAIIDAIVTDGPLVISGSILVMLLASWLLMGGWLGPLVVFGTVGIAILWLTAIMAINGWKTNLFNLIALPLLVGMGQDDALHLFHRYREGRDLRAAVKETGSAIFLTSWTTAIGFAGIFFANHRGLVSLAWVSVIGVMLCWLSSVVVLPAIIQLFEWQRRRSETGAVAE